MCELHKFLHCSVHFCGTFSVDKTDFIDFFEDCIRYKDETFRVYKTNEGLYSDKLIVNVIQNFYNLYTKNI